MKKVILLTLLTSLGVMAQANLLQNPGFEEGTAWITLPNIPGWLSWNGSGGVTADAGRTIDTQALLMWWVDSGVYQNFPVVAGHTYRFEGYMMHPANDPLRNGAKTAEIRAEWYDINVAKLGEDVVGVLSQTDPAGTWLLFSTNLVAPPGAVTGRYLLRMYQPTTGDGVALYDNASVYDYTLYGQAYGPNPADGATVLLSLDQVSWKNNAARNPADTFSCKVYLEAEGPVIDPNFHTAPIATGVTSGMVNLASAGVTLSDNTVYTWRVDSTDPNSSGSPKTFTGPVWTFQVGDVIPTVDAGPNQYVWLVDGPETFRLTGSYTDDGKSTITRAEFVEGNHEKAGGTTVTMGTQTWNPTARTVTVDVTVDNTVPGQVATGWYGFTLEVEDAIGAGSDIVHAGVYGTCLEAAMADPDDVLADTYPNGHGDINGDCKTDLEDFALLASSWIDCMTAKAGCTP